VLEPAIDRVVRDAEVGDRFGVLGVMARDVPGDRASPVVPDPDRLLPAERLEQLEHVSHDVLLRVDLVPRVHAGAPVATHVGRDGAQAERGQRRKLVPPAVELRPSMQKADEPVLGACGELEGGVAGGPGRVLGDRHRRSLENAQPDGLDRSPWGTSTVTLRKTQGKVG
jgi:hypothetical protein